jgi:hypothetical protein
MGWTGLVACMEIDEKMAYFDQRTRKEKLVT